ncbi:hypothetical protein BDQ12DRAFT_672120 [Crucibulum laeve]|uniref:Uncharacterized protein n=1 Tax=Crucibulum laeve TaxID=68775 RepID=A0A5C3LE35_9AGAR|nr:hypothetical protein BDQ12DRAFT_672120 [Crucibulum laeve]
MTLPEALDNRIKAAAMVTKPLFLVDDLLDVWNDDQRKRFFNRFRGLIFGFIQPDQNDLLEIAVADIYSHIRLSDQVDPLQLGQRFCEENYRVLIASINQEERDSIMQQNNLQRCRSVVGYDLIQWTCNIALPEHIMANPMLHSLKRAAGTHGVLINNIFSYRRETVIAKNRSASGILDIGISYLHVFDVSQRGCMRRKTTCWPLFVSFLLPGEDSKHLETGPPQTKLSIIHSLTS